jgi:hypothetical protein
MATEYRDQIDAAFADGFEDLARCCYDNLPPEARAEVWGEIGSWVHIATERLFAPSAVARRNQFQTLMAAMFMWGRNVERMASEPAAGEGAVRDGRAP